MTDSSAAPTSFAELRDDAGSATAQLWQRRARGVHATSYAAALIGDDVATLTDAVSITLAASSEAAALLDGMEFRVRTLPTTVHTSAERCVNSVRGPILWSETITARANALGNDDVFVCATTSRSFDTVENRVLVGALEAIARAGRALRGPTGQKVPADAVEQIASAAEEAAHWRRHPRLTDVSAGRLSGRDMSRLRGGHRLARMADVLAIRQRAAEPFVAEDVIGLSDRWTRRYHAFALHVLDVLSASIRLPSTFSFSDEGLWCGPVSWRHPKAPGGTPAGICYRGVPLLPPNDMLVGAPWSGSVPTDGVRIMGVEDIDRIGEQLGGRPIGGGARTSNGTQASSGPQASMSSSWSSWSGS